jgi:flagellar hook protein FlgE
MTVINSLGEQVTLTTTFTKSATTGQWDYSMSADTSNASSGTITVTGGSGSLVFNSSGALTSANADQTVSLSGFPSGAADLSMAWDLMDSSGASNGDVTSFATASVTNSITQDGHSTGVLKGISINEEGVISGIFSNGQTQELMQLALADFLSPWGLSRQGNSLYAESAESGQPNVGTAETGGFGSIVGSSLEQSNVDLGTEFVNLITTQRAYQANSRIITSVNEMLVEAVNLVR